MGCDFQLISLESADESVPHAFVSVKLTGQTAHAVLQSTDFGLERRDRVDLLLGQNGHDELLFDHTNVLGEPKTAAISDGMFSSQVLNVEFLLLRCLSERIFSVQLHQFLLSEFRSGNRYRIACHAIVIFHRFPLLAFTSVLL